ncbi:MAG TPA: 2,3-diaminopropionate biosynthesis protein SbnA [Pyrinomonadaceae bacterium]
MEIEGILATIGNTPLVRLKRIPKDVRFRLFAKMEGLNPGGSTKDRPALSILKNGLETGAIDSQTVILESSSGNMGIGLAQVCSYLGLRFICVVDPKTTQQNIRLLKAYGAEVDLVKDPDPMTGEFLQARILRVQQLLRTVPNSYWPNQYSHTYNATAHHRTMDEVVSALGGEVDYLFCATSTCGTLRGCAEYVRKHKLRTKIIAVDAVGSVIFGGNKGPRMIPGHGAAVKPELFQNDLASLCVHVSDIDCVVGCRRLIKSEAILAGGSSGAVIMAIEYFKEEIPPDATCVALFPDRGERYLDTIYSDSWVAEHFGDISHLWQDTGEAQTCAMVP